MGHRRLGSSAIYVSDICMGTMTFGSQTDEAETFRILDACYDRGINFYDTAEGYPVPPRSDYVGRTEEFFGRWLKTKPRDAIILATKVSGASHTWFRSPCREGMTVIDRHNIIKAIDGSLKRLQTDYVDLYQTHWPDHDAPYEEVMETLDELVRMGKVRVVGCSNETSWGVMKSLAVSDKLGTVRHQTIQNNFSLNNRRFSDELAQVCRKEGISLLPYSPLAGGVLSGKYQNGQFPEGARFSNYQRANERQRKMSERFVNDRSLAATARVMEIAEQAGLHPVTLATAWSKQHDYVASTIVGVTSLEQCAPIFEAMDLVLSNEVMSALHQLGKDIPYPMG